MITIRQVRPDKRPVPLQSGESTDPWQATLIALACHANSDRTGTSFIEVHGLEHGLDVLELQCASESCHSSHVRYERHELPKEQLALAALQFHSWHEGHGLIVTVNGERLHPRPL